MNKARFHEQYLHWHNWALTTLFISLAARGGKCVYFPGVGYAVNDPELALEILHHEAFTSTGKGSMDAFIGGIVGDAALFNMEGAAHREMRSRLNDVFARRNLDNVIANTVRELAHVLCADLQAGKPVDLVAFTHQMTSQALCAVLGVQIEGPNREAQFNEIAHLATNLTSFLGLDKLEQSPANIASARPHYEKLLSFAAGSYHSADTPENTLITKMREAGADFAEASGLIAVMLVAGTETVSAALPRLIASLLDSGQFAALAANPQALNPAIVEGLRFVCPSPAIPRGIARDVEIGGFRFKKNRRLFILLVNALKRPEYFPDPWRFNTERKIEARMKHLCFGVGAHFCIGFPLAQREISIVLEQLLQLPGTPRIIERRYPRNMSFPAYKKLVLQLDHARD